MSRREGETVKVTLTLRADQVIRMDRLAIDVRASTGAILTRGEVLRAIIDATEAAQIQTGLVTSEEDLRLQIVQGLACIPASEA